MIDFKPFDHLRVVTGLRYEYDYSLIENNIESYHHKYVKAEHIYAADILPAVNLNYALNKMTNLKFAYSKTVARPAFREIAPYAYYDFKEGWRVVGNPDLERTLINNIDLRYENFIRGGQIISLSLFYKHFNAPIELIDDPRAGNTELRYVNIENSNLYGIELELRKNLDFINLNNYLIGGNFTLLKSEVEVAEDFGGENNSLISKRPMYGQAPWVLNTFVNYNNKEIKLKTNLSFNITGKKLTVVTKGDTPNIYKNPFAALNLKISKSIGKNLSIKIGVKNILNSKYKQTYMYNNTEYNFRSYSNGRTFSFGISFLIT